MSKIETKSFNLSISLNEAKENLLSNIEKTDEFSLQNIIMGNENILY